MTAPFDGPDNSAYNPIGIYINSDRDEGWRGSDRNVDGAVRKARHRLNNARLAGQAEKEKTP
jgi:hypothetical protein